MSHRTKTFRGVFIPWKRRNVKTTTAESQIGHSVKLIPKPGWSDCSCLPKIAIFPIHMKMMQRCDSRVLLSSQSKSPTRRGSGFSDPCGRPHRFEGPQGLQKTIEAQGVDPARPPCTTRLRLSFFFQIPDRADYTSPYHPTLLIKIFGILSISVPNTASELLFVLWKLVCWTLLEFWR